MNALQNWYALYTTTGAEKKITDLLSKKGITYYYALNKIVAKQSDKKKLISYPLFPNLVFVYVAETEHGYLKKIPGVLNMMYWLNRPAIFGNEDIHTLQIFLEEHGCVELKKIAVTMNEMMKIVCSDFSAAKENDGSSRSKTVELILPSLGFSLSAKSTLLPAEALSDKAVAIGRLNNVTAVAS